MVRATRESCLRARSTAWAAPAFTPDDPRGRLEGLSRRAAAFAAARSFRFLSDPSRNLLSPGSRAADAEGPGHLDPAHYDLLASEARLASFIAIAKGALPEKLQRLERVLSALEAEGQRAQVLHLDNRRRPEWVAVRFAGAGVGGPGSGGSPAASR